MATLPPMLWRVHRELVRGAHVHPAVHQHQRWQMALLRAPVADVVIEVAQWQRAAAGGLEGLVHGERGRAVSVGWGCAGGSKARIRCGGNVTSGASQPWGGACRLGGSR